MVTEQLPETITGDDEERQERLLGTSQVTALLPFPVSKRIAPGLGASSPGRSGGGAGKGRRACNYVLSLLSLQFPCGFPSTELPDSANQRKVGKSANVNKH